ncbi:histidine phosphatase family protein [Pseudomonas hydrolytica]|uniref:histidine phosphatase family protein n=1 Tax=Ectopseudomonas hydrolytica TaxID=2493633 RepID=UPI001010210C
MGADGAARQRPSLILCLLALLLAPLWALAAEQEEQAWQALREGRALLILRHTTAPGTGDPAHFQLGNCSTQRNLSQQGREEARRWGALLRSQGIGRPRLFSSRWCRALDTAREMGLGTVQPLPALDSFFALPGNGSEQTSQLIRTINLMPPGEPLVLVSHQVNITALTRIFPASGEGLILALPLRAAPQVLARIAPPR